MLCDATAETADRSGRFNRESPKLVQGNSVCLSDIDNLGLVLAFICPANGHVVPVAHADLHLSFQIMRVPIFDTFMFACKALLGMAEARKHVTVSPLALIGFLPPSALLVPTPFQKGAPTASVLCSA
jgi:hypothetical protein